MTTKNLTVATKDFLRPITYTGLNILRIEKLFDRVSEATDEGKGDKIMGAVFRTQSRQPGVPFESSIGTSVNSLRMHIRPSASYPSTLNDDGTITITGVVKRARVTDNLTVKPTVTKKLLAGLKAANGWLKAERKQLANGVGSYHDGPSCSLTLPQDALSYTLSDAANWMPVTFAEGSETQILNLGFMHGGTIEVNSVDGGPIEVDEQGRIVMAKIDENGEIKQVANYRLYASNYNRKQLADMKKPGAQMQKQPATQTLAEESLADMFSSTDLVSES